MNYLNQIRGFWIAQEGNQLSTTDIALYFYLLEVCNKCAWAGRFRRNNSKILADLAITFKTMQRSRDRLQQFKLIEFTTKNGDPNVSYSIVDLGNFSRGQGGGPVQGSVQGSGGGPVQDNINQTNLKQNHITADKSAVTAEEIFKQTNPLENFQSDTFPQDSGKEERKKSCAKKKKEEKSAMHWRPLVARWFEYHEFFTKQKPRFRSVEGARLKSILLEMERRAAGVGKEWTEEVAVDQFTKFLDTARQDPWLAKNFLLKNLDAQFDIIFVQMTNPQAASRPAQTKQSPLHTNVNAAAEAVAIIRSSYSQAQ